MFIFFCSDEFIYLLVETYKSVCSYPESLNMLQLILWIQFRDVTSNDDFIETDLYMNEVYFNLEFQLFTEELNNLLKKTYSTY